MPEGHTIHRIALDHRERFGGRVVQVSSPQGRFVAAQHLDGRELLGIDAFGKNLMYNFGEDKWVHVHLGLFGKVRTDAAPAPLPGPNVRMRLVNAEWFADLVGPTRCALIDAEERQAFVARLGPDPLRKDAKPQNAYARIASSHRPVGALLMDQHMVAGIGNVFRAEVLFRARLNPYLPGTSLALEQWTALWADLRRLMRAGVRRNRIITTEPQHRDHPTGRVRDDDAFYVYRRTGEPCRVCGQPIAMAELVGRRLYWCPHCQP